MSQEEIGKKIGLSKSGISNIENGTRNVTDKHIKLICNELSINEEWLRNGTGEMKSKTPSNIMEQLKKEFNLDEFSYDLIYEYLKLSQEQRQIVRNFFYNVVKTDTTINSVVEPTKTIEELEQEYIKSRSNSVHKMTSSVLNITEDINKENSKQKIG